jgi:hypothetical protein
VLELSEAATLQSFGTEAVEVVNAEFPAGGLFAEQVIGDFEDIATDRQHCSSVPYVSAQATITCAKGGLLGAV